MTVNLPFVMDFVIYLTNRCNLACEMCSQYGEGYKENAHKELTITEWKKFFREIADTNPKPKIILMGGEPLLYKDFDSFIDILKNYNFPLHIVTNATLLNKHLEALKDSGATITISLDALNEKHDKIRGKQGTFDKVINNIKIANQLQKKGANFKLFINSVLLPDNIDELSNFVEYMQQFNIEQFVFQHLQFATPKLQEKTNSEWENLLGCKFDGDNFTTKKQYQLTEEYIQKIKENLEKVSNICKKEAFVFPCLNNNEIKNYYLDKDLNSIRPYLTCTTPWLNAFISPDGNVSNCIGNQIGNLKENNFWSLWNNEKANRIRTALCHSGSFDFCKKCCNFYKENFLLAPNGEIIIGNKTLLLPSELNYIKACSDGVFILDKNSQTESDKIPVIPIEIYSQEQLNEIKKKETIINYFKDIKGVKNEN